MHARSAAVIMCLLCVLAGCGSDETLRAQVVSQGTDGITIAYCIRNRFDHPIWVPTAWSYGSSESDPLPHPFIVPDCQLMLVFGRIHFTRAQLAAARAVVEGSPHAIYQRLEPGEAYASQIRMRLPLDIREAPGELRPKSIYHYPSDEIRHRLGVFHPDLTAVRCSSLQTAQLAIELAVFDPSEIKASSVDGRRRAADILSGQRSHPHHVEDGYILILSEQLEVSIPLAAPVVLYDFHDPER